MTSRRFILLVLLNTRASCTPDPNWIPTTRSQRNPSSLNSLSTRTQPCPQEDYSPCGQGLPDNFCCESSHTCFVLASNTTALCCPGGSNCSVIQPIICDVQFQNATAYPESEVFTTDLSKQLPACGEGTCCPFGFRCNGGHTYVMETFNTTSPTLVTTSGISSRPILSTLPPQDLHTTPPTTSRISPTISSTTSLVETSKTISTSSVRVIRPSPSLISLDTPVASTPILDHGVTGPSKEIRVGLGVTIGTCIFVGIALFIWLQRRRRRRRRRISTEGNSTPLLSTKWDPFPFSRTRTFSTLPPKNSARFQSATSLKRYSMTRKQTSSLPEELSRLPPWQPSSIELSPKMNTFAVPEVPGAAELPATPLSCSFWNNSRGILSQSNLYNSAHSQPNYGWPS
ncbi:hypothetical protein F5X99DRAFT_372571 [Biscogniauxia marginata]|nr:hypothetical protein F5X99DRAFT_372571 [Biscogniauxia marginata]